jgi:hypothetical protein
VADGASEQEVTHASVVGLRSGVTDGASGYGDRL